MVLLELLGEATAGVLVEELLKTVGELGRSVTRFKREAERLRRNLLFISPLIKRIEDQNHAVGREPEVQQFLAYFRESLEEGQKFVCKCLKVRGWQISKRIRYKKQLDKLDESLRGFRENMQFLTTRDASETLHLVKRIHLYLPVFTELTVSIVQIQQVRLLVVHFTDPTCIHFRRPYEYPFEGRSTGWFDSGRLEICMGQIHITMDHELIVRRKIYSEESNEYRIDLDSGVFDGHIISFVTAIGEGTAYLQGIAGKSTEYGRNFWIPNDDGSIRRHILYGGLAWGENLTIRRGSATMRLGSEGLHSSVPWIPSCPIPPWTPRRRATLRHPNSENSSGAGVVASHDNCYAPMENETCAAGEVVSHDGSFNSDNREKENDDTEEMSRKCLKEQLHVLQGTVNGQKLLIATCVMVCFLSLIMNFVILTYK